MEGSIILLLIFSAVGSGYLSMLVAQSKGHEEHWFLAGLALGPIGVIAAAGLGDRISQRHLRRIAAQASEITEASFTPESEPEPELPSSFLKQVATYDVPNEIAKRCIEASVFALYGSETESFFKKSDDLQRRCSKLASLELNQRAFINIDTITKFIREMADSNLVEITFGPFGGIDKIRVLNRPT